MIQLASGLFVALLVAAAGVLVVRSFDRQRRWSTRQTFVLSFPRGLGFEDVESFIASLSGLQGPRWQRSFGLPSLVWEVRASVSEIAFVLEVEAGAVEFVLGQLRGAFPALRAKAMNAPAFAPTLAAELRLQGSNRLLSVEHPVSIAAAMLASLHPLRDGEELLMQWVISPGLHRPQGKGSFEILRAATMPTRPPTRSNPIDKAMRAKAQGPQFLASCRLAVRADSPERSRQLLRRLLGVWHITSNAHAGFRRRLLPSWLVGERVRQARAALLVPPCALNGRELAALLAVPQGDVTAPGLDLGRARQLPVPAGLPRQGAAFAISNYPGHKRALTFGPQSLPFHAWLVGGTGSGKSTLLLQVIASYMREGAAIIAIDSKRDLITDAVELIPENRIHDLVLLDPADDHPVGLNLLATTPEDADRVSDQLVGIFTRLWPGYVGPRSQDILRACFQTLAKTPANTLVEAPALLLDEGYRRALISQLDDPIVLQPQWAAYESLSKSERAAQIAAPLNKLRAVLARRALRDIVGQSEGLDIADVLRRGSILMVPLSKGLIGEDAAALLGSLVLLKTWQALTARVGLASTDRRPVLVILDEFQDYMSVPLSFADMLAQARALGVGVLAAHQHLGQLPARLRQDLRANARTKIAFQLAAPDAKVFAQEFAPFLTAADLQGLGRYEVAAQICVDGEVLPPATATTLPPPPPSGFGERARQLSRQRFGRDRAEVEAEIRKRHGERPGEGSIGRRRRSA